MTIDLGVKTAHNSAILMTIQCYYKTSGIIIALLCAVLTPKLKIIERTAVIVYVCHRVVSNSAADNTGREMQCLVSDISFPVNISTYVHGCPLALLLLPVLPVLPAVPELQCYQHYQQNLKYLTSVTNITSSTWPNLSDHHCCLINNDVM